MKTRDLALTALFAATYYTITLVIAPIAYMDIQCRVSDAMYALIPLFGLPMIIGTTIANFFGNLSSPIGLLDWISPFIFIFPQLLVWKLGNRALPVFVTVISIWVGFILNVTFGIPLMMIVWIWIGEAIAQIGIGIPLYKAVKKYVKVD